MRPGYVERTRCRVRRCQTAGVGALKRAATPARRTSHTGPESDRMWSDQASQLEGVPGGHRSLTLDSTDR